MDINSFRFSKPIYIHAAGGMAAGAASVSDIAGRIAACADAEPIELRGRAMQAAPRVSRMASRFSQLAVLGVVDCLRSLEGGLDPDSRVYLGTGLGDVAHTDALYYSVMPPQSQLPQPARFVTSGNNIAAFFVAQHVELSARNLTLSQGELSLECALELVLSDFAANAMPSALVGGVDEATMPREFYTRRFHVEPDQMIGEGSGWLVLDSEPERNLGRVLGAILDVRVMAASASSNDGSWVTQVRKSTEVFARDRARISRLTLLPGTGLGADDILALKSELQAQWSACECQDYLQWSGRFPTAAALGIAGIFSVFANREAGKHACIHVNRDAAGRTGVIVFEVYSGKSNC